MGSFTTQTRFLNHRRTTPNLAAKNYTAGKSMGGLITVESAPAFEGSGCTLNSITLVDAEHQSPAVSILVFDSAPAATIADNGTVALTSADAAKLCAVFNIASSDWVAAYGISIATLGNLAKDVLPVERNLYLVVVANEAVVYANSDAIKVRLVVVSG